MTPAQKHAALASIALRAQIAEKTGELPATVKSWRELHANVAAREAEDIILARTIEERPEE